MNEKVRKIIDRIKGAGYEVYIVGGYVRDKILGIQSKDIDLATNALPSDLLLLFADRNEYSINEIGKSFGVIMADGVEIATYRRDRYKGLSDKDVEVSYSDNIIEDLARRDLTVNAMAMDPQSGEIIDPFGGHSHLLQRIISFVGNPSERIHEDPNRIIRACRFKAKIDGIFETSTFQALKEKGYLVNSHIVSERIYKEIAKSMNIKKASVFFYSLKEIDVLKYIFPSLDTCWKHNHGKWHTEDVFDHQMVCGDFLSIKNGMLKLTGYLHDCGKPKSSKMSKNGDWLCFHEHEHIGEKLLDEELKSLKFSIHERLTVTGLTRLHMRHLYKLTPKAKRKLLNKMYDDYPTINLEDIFRLQIADRKSNSSLAKYPYSYTDIRTVLKDFKSCKNDPNTAFSVKDLKVSGGDIMETFRIPSGPKIGEILKKLLEAVLDKPSLNNKDTLLKLVTDWKKETKNDWI